MQSTGTRPKVAVSGGGRGVVGHAGTRMLADIAEVTGLTSGFGDALGGVRQRRPVHEPGRVAVDVAVMLADGGETISDLGVLRHQPTLFGQVASDATAWRVLADLDDQALSRLRAARAAAREVAWAQACETRGRFPASKAAGREVAGLVLDMDATLVICHSEKEAATRTWAGRGWAATVAGLGAGGDMASSPWACARRNVRQLVSAVRGAGPSRRVARIRRTVPEPR